MLNRSALPPGQGYKDHRGHRSLEPNSLLRRHTPYFSGYLLGQSLLMLAAHCWFWYQAQLAYPLVTAALTSLQIVMAIAAALLVQRQRLAAVGVWWALILIALLLLAVFVGASGGHTNPLISLLLLPVAVAAVALPRIAAATIAVVAMIAYSLLTHYYWPLVTHHSDHESMMQLHLAGMWFSFALSIALILILVMPLVAISQQQQQQLAAQREAQLRDEQLISIATSAAQAAHKLGTPLSTLALLAEDVIADPDDQATLQQQVQICRGILSDLMQRSNAARQHGTTLTSLAALGTTIRQQFNLLYPGRSLDLTTEGNADTAVPGGELLITALLNFIDNAIRVSRQAPTLTLACNSGERLSITLEDTGPGLPDAIKAGLGQPWVSTRPDGMGLGLYLSHATIERMGGSVEFQDTGAGTRIVIELPLETARDE